MTNYNEMMPDKYIENLSVILFQSIEVTEEPGLSLLSRWSQSV